MRKILTLIAALSLVASLAVGGSIAYLSDIEQATNVMTMGKVDITLIEQQRSNGDNSDLVDFKDGTMLLPIVGSAQGDKDLWGVPSTKTAANFMDKIVRVKNEGNTDAWVRVFVAIPAAFNNLNNDGDKDTSDNALHISLGNRFDAEKKGTYNDKNDNSWKNDTVWDWYGAYSNAAPDFTATIDGVDYVVTEYIRQTKLPAGATTDALICGAYLDSHVDWDEDTNKYFYRFDNGNKVIIDFDTTNGVTIPVLVQAVQAEGFIDAKTALDAAFGTDPDAWFSDVSVGKIFSWEGVNYVTEGDTVTANSDSGTTVYRGILSDGKTNASNVVIGEGITRLNNRALCKAPTITSVSLPNSLTYIDESAFQQSAIKEIVVPENVTYIGKQAFGACGSLEKIVINAKNVSIANYVARACANLKEVVINSDSVTFEEGSMYFTNKENADASGITFYVKNQAMADVLYNAFSTSHSYGMLIKSIDGATTYYNTLK